MVKIGLKTYEKPVSTELGIDPVLPLCTSETQTNGDVLPDMPGEDW